MLPVINLVSQRFGKLVVKERSLNQPHGNACWLCICDCGKETVVPSNKLKTGHTNSCGCYRTEKRIKHGSHLRSGRTRTYQSWANMIQRVSNPKNAKYSSYGGRGITASERWTGENGFKNFLTDMGERPENKTLDREEVNGNYEPDNCRWATSEEQGKNKRKYGVLMSFSDEELLQEVNRRKLSSLVFAPA